MLDNLVLGTLGTTANNESVATSQDRDSILADFPEPDVGQGAGSETVHALKSIAANNDVRNGSAILEDEHSTVTASVFITVARSATIKLPVAEIDTTRDGGWRSKCNNRANTCGDVEGLGGAETSGKSRKLDMEELHLE